MLRNFKIKPLLLLTFIVGGLAASGWLYSWWNSPAVSRPISVTQSATGVLGSDTQLTSWQTAYFDTQLPTFLRVRSSVENPNRPQLGQYQLSNVSPSQTDQVAVTVGSLSNGSLAEQSAVRVRQSQPDTYGIESRSFAPSGAYVFGRTDSYETAVVWQHDRNYVAVVVSGTIDRKPDLEQALSAIVANWQWK